MSTENRCLFETSLQKVKKALAEKGFAAEQVEALHFFQMSMERHDEIAMLCGQHFSDEKKDEEDPKSFNAILKKINKSNSKIWARIHADLAKSPRL